jgi:FtsH-binding integral membrane protein
MTNSRNIAGLVGPMLIALTISESEFVQPHLYEAQIPPVVYLSGALIFLAGLSIVRVHNRWETGWPVLLTLIGWFAILGGLGRMFAAGQYDHVAQHTNALLVAEIILLAAGIFLTLKAYGRQRTSKRRRKVKT